MARSGSSSKFVPVNLNNSYGQNLPLSSGGTSASSGLGRSRSFSNSYGGMVSLSRSSRVTSSSSSSSSTTVSRTSKLAVPRPVNLPSLRREHSGNHPTTTLVGSLGSSGWSKQYGDESADVNASRSDAIKGDTTSWGNNRAAAIEESSVAAERRLLSGGRQSTYSSPGAPVSVAKAVVFRGEEFPTLQCAARPPSPSPPARPRSRDSQQKHHPGSSYEDYVSQQKEPSSGDNSQKSNRLLDRQLQPAHPAQPIRMHARSTLLDEVDDDVARGSAFHRGPSPLKKLTLASNWADDERETLSSFRTQESSQQSDWGERNDTGSNWSFDCSANIVRRTGFSGRNEPDFLTHTLPASKFINPKDGDLMRGHLDGSRFEHNLRGNFERTSNNVGRNDILKIGLSFPTVDSKLNKDARYQSLSSRLDQDGYSDGRAYIRGGNNTRYDVSGRDVCSRDIRPGTQHGEWHDSMFGKDIFLGRQGFPGGVTPTGPRLARGTGFSLSGSDVKAHTRSEYKRENRVSGYYGQAPNEDPFLGEGISSGPHAFYVSQPKVKKDFLTADVYYDPARESFEAELERVEKLLDQERQRAVEERERAIELARKEQEEQERIAREEEELRLKLEEVAREAEYRVQKEAEEAARKVEEGRRAREEEKRITELKEERRKEAARKKLLELEERMAKRDLEKRQEESLQKERGLLEKQEEALQEEKGSAMRTILKDVSTDNLESGPGNKNEINRGPHWTSLSSPGKLEQDSEQVPLEASVLGNNPLPSILWSPRVSSSVKEEKGFLIEGGRLAQTWKRGIPIGGHEPYSVQKGPQKFLHLQTDHSQQDNEKQRQAPLLRNLSAHKSSVRSKGSRASDDVDERDWWVRDTNGSLAYSENADLLEYPAFGRIRQSLPKQPRVLPPPPRNAVSYRQAIQADETQFGGSVGGTKYAEGSPAFKQESRLSTGDKIAGAGNEDASAHLSEQFDAVPSEEVVLSDVGSQFSDDTIEDVPAQAEQEQPPHSDAVSVTYTDREVDEISDLTEAQESSEDGDTQKPADWEVCQGDQNKECVVECLEEASLVVQGSSEGQLGVGRGDLITCTEIKDDKGMHDANNANGSCLVADAASDHLEGSAHDVSIPEQVEKQSALYSELQSGKEALRKMEEPTLEKAVQDQVMHSSLHQVPFLPVSTSDVTDFRRLEGSGSRQSLVQQFQQPFSFMAVPLPQSGTHNQVGASLPMLSSVHAAPNQQELSFHMQLGLLPSMPLLPNAIQIGSIQMPLHIHPQIPQFTHLNVHQQAPVFQFGQIGPSLALSQPIPMTQMPRSAMQMLNASGQNSSTQHSQLHAEVVVAEGRNSNLTDCIGHGNLESMAAVETTSIVVSSDDSALKEHIQITQGTSGNMSGSTITTEREVELSIPVRKLEKAPTHSVSKFVANDKSESACKSESTWVGDSGGADYNARPAGKNTRGGWRSNPRYQGILGRGRGRFHGRSGHHYLCQRPHLAVENWPEGGTKRFSRGKMSRRNFGRVEYRVREPTPLFDPDTAVSASFSGPSPSIEKSEGYRYIKRGSGDHPANGGDENGQTIGAFRHSSSHITIPLKPVEQSVAAMMTEPKSLVKNYEVENVEDAPFLTGVVRIFDQPGIEINNDKDDFIKVRSKRQLLRESREQREKGNKAKTQDAGSKTLVGKKHQRSSAKVGVSGRMAATSLSKISAKRLSNHSDGKSSMPSFSNGTTIISTATSTKRSSTPSRAGRAASALKTVTLESESLTGHGTDNHTSEHPTTAAWGGQRSNQEVVSLTQIQFEEAMKPFRLDMLFPETVQSPKNAIPTVEPVLPCSSLVSAENTITSMKASGPLSSLLAGEKIKFGAVTSPTLITPDNYGPIQVSAIRTGSPIAFGMDRPQLSSHTNSFATGFLDSHLDTAYLLNGGSERKDDGFEAKVVVDLEADDAAEAAASAVVAAAIDSEDLIDSHSNPRVSEMNVGCSSISSGSSVGHAGQILNRCASDNPIAEALPADLSVEIPPSLFQGSSMTFSNSSGVMLQSLQGGAPTFPCLEMGPLIGGPVVNFDPREDASMASMGPGLSGWQQRHVGNPDSFYRVPSFLSPAGLPSIQGQPHMLVYTNPYTPVGQFGQLGVSFMGTTYHPSGTQPDWTHVPIPSSGALSMNSGDVHAGLNRSMTSRHHNGLSDLMQTQRAPIVGSSVMSIATPPHQYDTGFTAPFQSPWSKAPAPPVHSVSAAGSVLPMSRPALDLNLQVHSFCGSGHHLIDGTSQFSQLSMRNPDMGSSFLSNADAGSQFPEVLGLGGSLPKVSNMQSTANGPLFDADHSSSTTSTETVAMRMQQGRRPSQGSQRHMNSTNGRGISNSSFQEHRRSGIAAVGWQSKNEGRIGFSEQRSSEKVLPRDNAGGEYAKGSQRKGLSGRLSSLDRGGSSLPLKLKQIYVAKPAGDSRKLGATCS